MAHDGDEVNIYHKDPLNPDDDIDYCMYGFNGWPAYLDENGSLVSLAYLGVSTLPSGESGWLVDKETYEKAGKYVAPLG